MTKTKTTMMTNNIFDNKNAYLSILTIIIIIIKLIVIIVKIVRLKECNFGVGKFPWKTFHR